jgi:hypothetical protein
LPIFRHALHDSADVGQEAHVEHSIRFVEDGEADIVESNGALFQVINESAWGSDQNVGASSDLLDLSVHGCAADQNGGLNLE